MRDVAIQKAKEINFLMVCSKPDHWETCGKARRVAIHYSDVNEPIGNFASPNVRSLLFFCEPKSLKLDCSKYRVLRVFGNMKGNVKFQSFKGSPSLRYLQLHTKCIMVNERDFGEWIRGMKCLETLDLRESEHGDLPNWIWQVKTIRHIILSFMPAVMTPGPPASAELRSLQTLKYVGYNEAWEISGLPNMPEVRELGIKFKGKYSKEQVTTVVTSLGRLKNLVHLAMKVNFIELPKIVLGCSPFFENLQSLFITCHNYDSNNILVLSDNMMPPHLCALVLTGYQFESDPMPVLEKLGSLKVLEIYGIHIENHPIRRISCSAGGFQQLEELQFGGLLLEEWNIEKGSLPMLKRLKVISCPLLSVPPELIHLDNLQYLHWVPHSSNQEDAINNICKQRPYLLRTYWN